MKIYDDNLMRIFNWIRRLDPQTIDPFEAKKDESGDKVCSIFLPLINKTVYGYGKNTLEAGKDLASKAVPMIDNYLSEHPEQTVKDTYSFDTHDIIYDEELDYLLVSISEEEYERRLINRDKSPVLERNAFIDKFFNEYREKYNEENGLFIQIMSRDIFPDNMPNEEINSYLFEAVKALFNKRARTINICLEDNLIMVIGKILLEPEKIANYRR